MNTEPKPATGEWTVDTDIPRLLGDEKVGSQWQIICDAHNAALAAERERMVASSALGVTEQKQANEIQKLRAQLADLQRDYNVVCMARDSHAKQLNAVLPIRIELEKQLAAEKADNERLKQQYEMTALDCSNTRKREAAAQAAIIEATGMRLYDRKALDAAIAEATKPIVDALTLAQNKGNLNSEISMVIHDALAKVGNQ